MTCKNFVGMCGFTYFFMFGKCQVQRRLYVVLIQSQHRHRWAADGVCTRQRCSPPEIIKNENWPMFSKEMTSKICYQLYNFYIDKY